MGRHHLRQAEPRHNSAGYVMLGGVVDFADPRRAHWVPVDAVPVRYRLGTAYRAVCGTACVPAGGDYLIRQQACPACDQRERSFLHRAATTWPPDPPAGAGAPDPALAGHHGWSS
jgi:hypothetical protein